MQLINDGKVISTLDLFEKEYVLLVGSDGHEWQKAANQLAQTLSLPIKSYRIAADGDLSDPENRWHTIYEITAEGAVLVRPDGHVAWRSQIMIDSPIDILTEVLRIKELDKL